MIDAENGVKPPIRPYAEPYVAISDSTSFGAGLADAVTLWSDVFALISCTAFCTLTTPKLLVVKTTSSPLIFNVSPAVAVPLITVPLATLGIASTSFKKIATPVSVVVKSPEPSVLG